MSTKEPLTCPFCPFEDSEELFLVQHVENVHPEDAEAPSVARDSTQQDPYDRLRATYGKSDEDDYIECMCGEFCLSTDFDSHLEMHSAEGTTFDQSSRAAMEDVPTLGRPRGDKSSSDSDTPPRTPSLERLCQHGTYVTIDTLVDAQVPYTSRKKDSSDGQIRRLPKCPKTRASSKTTGPPKHRRPHKLGKAELGPHAEEDQMPHWLRKILERGAKVTTSNEIALDGGLLRIESVANEIQGIIPVISQLCSQDSAVDKAFLCHPKVTHVVKMNKEGGFCGYRNIQMIISYIQDTHSQGHEFFQGRVPSILRLQDMIESAWDKGFCSIGRIETGGIRGTRKYIGTPEAQALFESLRISCQAETFHESGKGVPHEQLLLTIEKYFHSGTADTSKKVCRTTLPPIYFQHPGHSLTVIGFERRKSGSCNLLVFDPMFQPSPAIRQLIGARFRHPNPEKLLKAYQRGESVLRKYKNFEILHLASPISLETGPNRLRWSGEH